MKELIDAATRSALELFGDRACREFQRRLAAGSLCSTRCDGCGRTAFPPREFCPRCHCRSTTWVELPRRATLYAFTTQSRSLRFFAPDVLGLVEVEGVGRFLSRIAAPLEALRIGEPLEVSICELAPGTFTHQYAPVAASGANP